MMNVYDIQTEFNYSQKHSVVAENMAMAEKLFKKKYWPITIREIRLHSEYVIVQGQEEAK